MHVLPRAPLRFAAFGAAALTIMVAAAAPAQADPQLFLGLQAAGVNGGAITMEAPVGGDNAYGTFSHIDISGLANPADIPPTPTLLLLQAFTIDMSTIPGTPAMASIR
jgi:hypothetical protein